MFAVQVRLREASMPLDAIKLFQALEYQQVELVLCLLCAPALEALTKIRLLNLMLERSVMD